MRGKGINYDTGFSPGDKQSRPEFDSEVARRELRIIATDLHCNVVRISGGDVGRLAIAGRHAMEAGLEVWFSPFPTEMSATRVLSHLTECAVRAEKLRAQGAKVVFVAGCELSVFAKGFLPGASAYDRMATLASPDPELWASLADVPARLNEFLAELAAAVRREFHGPVTYASAAWEPVDWGPFDIVAVDAYRDAGNAAGYRDDLQRHLSHGKPVAITEFGCCTYKGAGDRGGMGWAIVDESVEPRRIAGDYQRDESEQVAYMRELIATFEQAGVDSAFWFTFAGYRLPYRPDPRFDLDMASYGIVKVLEDREGTTYPGMPWEPKAAFDALAGIYAR